MSTSAVGIASFSLNVTLIEVPHIRRSVRVPADNRPLLRRFWLGATAVFCGLVAFGIYGQAAQSHALDTQVTLLQQQNGALRQQISERQREVIEAQTGAWLQEEARKLGYVFPGERVYVLTGPGTNAPAQGGVVAPLPSFSPPTPVPTPTPKPTASASPTPLQLSPASASPSPH